MGSRKCIHPCAWNTPAPQRALPPAQGHPDHTGVPEVHVYRGHMVLFGVWFFLRPKQRFWDSFLLLRVSVDHITRGAVFHYMATLSLDFPFICDGRLCHSQFRGVTSVHGMSPAACVCPHSSCSHPDLNAGLCSQGGHTAVPQDVWRFLLLHALTATPRHQVWKHLQSCEQADGGISCWFNFTFPWWLMTLGISHGLTGHLYVVFCNVFFQGFWMFFYWAYAFLIIGL